MEQTIISKSDFKRECAFFDLLGVEEGACFSVRINALLSNIGIPARGRSVRLSEMASISKPSARTWLTTNDTFHPNNDNLIAFIQGFLSHANIPVSEIGLKRWLNGAYVKPMETTRELVYVHYLIYKRLLLNPTHPFSEKNISAITDNLIFIINRNQKTIKEDALMLFIDASAEDCK